MSGYVTDDAEALAVALCDWFNDEDHPTPSVTGCRECRTLARVLIASGAVRPAADVRAEALEQAAKALSGETEGPMRFGTKLWPERDRDTYSLAIEEAVEVLARHAARLRAGGGE